MKAHNAHMLIPEDLWKRAKHEALLDGKSMTQYVCEALAAKIATRTQRTTN